MTETEPRRLVVMRHAKAESSASSDHARELTDRGRRDARAAGVHLASHHLEPGIVLVSSAARARTTWAEVYAGTGADTEPDIRVLDSLYGADEYDVLAACAAEIPAEAPTALVIGHNPTIAMTAQLLQPESGRRDLSFPTAAFAVLAIDSPWAQLGPETGSLLHLYTPQG